MGQYDFSVFVHRVIDGDTADLDFDVGFYLRAVVRVRVLGVDTPERGQAGWAEATAFTSQWLAARGGRLRATTTKTDSFGRWLADIYVPGPPVQHLATDLIAAGHGTPR